MHMYFHTYENMKTRTTLAGLLASAARSVYNDGGSLTKDQTA
jgi:hypothetical protein